MDQLNFTTINHIARKNLKLSLSEYVIADYIYHLSNNLKSKDGWCYASKKNMADEFGIGIRTVSYIVNRLIEKGVIIRNKNTYYLRSTLIWYEEVYFRSSKPLQKLQGGSAKIAGGSAKIAGGSAKIADYNNTNNNTNNNNLQTIHSVFDKTPDINKIIGLFKEVNPAYTELYKVRGQREAVQKLCLLYGEKMIQTIIGQLKEVIYKQYAPRITTPYTLLMKYGELVAYINQQHVIGDKLAFTQV